MFWCYKILKKGQPERINLDTISKPPREYWTRFQRPLIMSQTLSSNATGGPLLRLHARRYSRFWTLRWAGDGLTRCVGDMSRYLRSILVLSWSRAAPCVLFVRCPERCCLYMASTDSGMYFSGILTDSPMGRDFVRCSFPVRDSVYLNLSESNSHRNASWSPVVCVCGHVCVLSGISELILFMLSNIISVGGTTWNEYALCWKEKKKV